MIYSKRNIFKYLKILAIALYLLVSIPNPGYSYCDKYSYEQLIQKIKSYNSRKKFSRSIKCLRSYINKNSGNDELYLLLSKAYSYKKKYRKSKQALGKMKDKKSPIYFDALSDYYWYRSKPKRSIYYLKKSFNLSKDKENSLIGEKLVNRLVILNKLPSAKYILSKIKNDQFSKGRRVKLEKEIKKKELINSQYEYYWLGISYELEEQSENINYESHRFLFKERKTDFRFSLELISEKENRLEESKKSDGAAVGFNLFSSKPFTLYLYYDHRFTSKFSYSYQGFVGGIYPFFSSEGYTEVSYINYSNGVSNVELRQGINFYQDIGYFGLVFLKSLSISSIYSIKVSQIFENQYFPLLIYGTYGVGESKRRYLTDLDHQAFLGYGIKLGYQFYRSYKFEIGYGVIKENQFESNSYLIGLGGWF